MPFLKFSNDAETVNMDSSLVDIWGEQKQGDQSCKAFIVYHSGERCFTLEVNESLVALDKRIRAAKSGRSVVKKRK